MQWQEFAANFIPHIPDVCVSSLTGWASLMASVAENRLQCRRGKRHVLDP